jgi:hypothetical protein
MRDYGFDEVSKLRVFERMAPKTRLVLVKTRLSAAPPQGHALPEIMR